MAWPVATTISATGIGHSSMVAKVTAGTMLTRCRGVKLRGSWMASTVRASRAITMIRLALPVPRQFAIQ